MAGLLHYCYFTEDFNKKELILGRFLICKKVLVLDLFCKKRTPKAALWNEDAVTFSYVFVCNILAIFFL